MCCAASTALLALQGQPQLLLLCSDAQFRTGPRTFSGCFRSIQHFDRSGYGQARWHKHARGCPLGAGACSWQHAAGPESATAAAPHVLAGPGHPGQQDLHAAGSAGCPAAKQHLSGLPRTGAFRVESLPGGTLLIGLRAGGTRTHGLGDRLLRLPQDASRGAGEAGGAAARCAAVRWEHGAAGCRLQVSVRSCTLPPTPGPSCIVPLLSIRSSIRPPRSPTRTTSQCPTARRLCARCWRAQLCITLAPW